MIICEWLVEQPNCITVQLINTFGCKKWIYNYFKGQVKFTIEDKLLALRAEIMQDGESYYIEEGQWLIVNEGKYFGNLDSIDMDMKYFLSGIKIEE